MTDPSAPTGHASSEVRATAHDAHGPSRTHCENCGEKLHGPWCHACGQHDFEFHRSFRHVFMEALESFLHFEGKFFRNIVTLLFRPGRLTAAFNAGKRASQMPPFRLYVFVSIVFFFLLIVGDNSATQPVVLSEHDIESFRRIQTGGVDGNGAPSSDLDRMIVDKALRAITAEGKRQLVESFMSALPKLLLLCLPFFALYTRFLFRKSGQVYLQHLVLALHFHTFVYLWVLVRDGWVFLGGLAGTPVGKTIAFAGNLWLVLYPVLMVRHLFRNSWFRTLLKTGILAAAYLFTIAIGFGITAAIIFFVS